MSSFPRRILYINHVADLYGASRALLHLVEALDRDRYEPLVALPQAGPLADELRARGVEPLVAPYLQTLWGHLVRSWRLLPFGLRLLPSALAARRLIREQRADLVHSNVWTVLSGALGAQLAGAPHVWHVREILPSMIGLKPALVRFSLRRSQRVICISRAVADQFAGQHGAERVRVVYDGLPPGQERGARDLGLGIRDLGTGVRDLKLADSTERVDRAPSPKSQVPGEPGSSGGREFSARVTQGDTAQAPRPKPLAPEVVIGVVGRLHPQKGQSDLLRAYAQLIPQARLRCRLVLAGGASPGHELHAADLANLARNLDIAERVTFLGFVEHARALIASLDILVLPATRPEGLGGVLLEAMAASVPVIATACGGTTEVVEHGVTGLLVPPHDPAALSGALAQLVKDDQLRRRMGEAGRHAVERRFSAARMADQVMQIYDEVLG